VKTPGKIVRCLKAYLYSMFIFFVSIKKVQNTRSYKNTRNTVYWYQHVKKEHSRVMNYHFKPGIKQELANRKTKQKQKGELKIYSTK
jgi:hypothetical protein